MGFFFVHFFVLILIDGLSLMRRAVLLIWILMVTDGVGLMLKNRLIGRVIGVLMILEM
jgi:hypothetical protein